MLSRLSLLADPVEDVVQCTDVTIPVHRLFNVVLFKGCVIAFIPPNQKTLDVARQDLQLRSVEHVLHPYHLLF